MTWYKLGFVVNNNEIYIVIISEILIIKTPKSDILKLSR